MNDQAIEQEIQVKGKTAPRVTPADIEANIESEAYFTAANGVAGAASTPERMGKLVQLNRPELGLLTFCVLILKNGFTVTGESACVSPENFDAEIGRKVARENAVQKIWPLMGYALKEQLDIAAKFKITGTPENFSVPLPDGSSYTITKNPAAEAIQDAVDNHGLPG